MLLSELRDDTIALCQEIAGKVDFTKERVHRMINRGYYDFARRTGCIEDRLDITSVANQVAYDKNDDADFNLVYKIHEIRHIENGITEIGRKLKLWPGGYANLPETIIYSSSPEWYWVRGMQTEGGTTLTTKQFGTWPVLSASSDTLRIHASFHPSGDLSSDSDQPKIVDGWRDALVYYAAWRLFMNYQHSNPFLQQKANDMERRYFDLVNDFKMNANEQVDDFEQIVDVYGD